MYREVRLERTAALVDIGHGISPVYYFKRVVMLSSKAGLRSAGAAGANKDAEGLPPCFDSCRSRKQYSIARAHRRACLEKSFHPLPPLLGVKIMTNTSTPSILSLVGSKNVPNLRPGIRPARFKRRCRGARARVSSFGATMPWTASLWRTSGHFAGPQRWDASLCSSSSLRTRRRKPCGPPSRMAGSPAPGATGNRSIQAA